VWFEQPRWPARRLQVDEVVAASAAVAGPARGTQGVLLDQALVDGVGQHARQRDQQALDAALAQTAGDVLAHEPHDDAVVDRGQRHRAQRRAEVQAPRALVVVIGQRRHPADLGLGGGALEPRQRPLLQGDDPVPARGAAPEDVAAHVGQLALEREQILGAPAPRQVPDGSGDAADTGLHGGRAATDPAVARAAGVCGRAARDVTDAQRAAHQPLPCAIRTARAPAAPNDAIAAALAPKRSGRRAQLPHVPLAVAQPLRHLRRRQQPTALLSHDHAPQARPTPRTPRGSPSPVDAVLPNTRTQAARPGMPPPAPRLGLTTQAHHRYEVHGVFVWSGPGEARNPQALPGRAALHRVHPPDGRSDTLRAAGAPTTTLPDRNPWPAHGQATAETADLQVF
jgi:hypothetical protein